MENGEGPGQEWLWHCAMGEDMKSPGIDFPDNWCMGMELVLGSAREEDVLLEGKSGEVVSLLLGCDSTGLRLEMRTDARPEPLYLSVPVAYTEKEGSRRLLLCWHGHRVSLYFDGELVDEEWPMGIFEGKECILRSRSRAVLSVGFAEGCGPEEQMAGRRETSVVTGSLQYWTPPGVNTRVGDCMPFWQDDRFHLYYLLDRRGHKSKWGLGAHEWAHVSTTDLKTWEIHPLAIPITRQWEGSICTGSVFCSKGVYYAFYAVRMSDQSPARLTWAVSRDGVRFEKTERYIYLKEPYEPVSARDPMVFADEAGLFHMLVTTELTSPEAEGQGGCLAHLVSADLEKWEQRDPFIIPGYTDQPECCDYFRMNGWYYLIFSNYGVAKYRMSRQPFGPWSKPRVDVLDGYSYRVPKTAAFGAGRRLAVGFLAKTEQEYAGCAVLREILQNNDGTLSTAFPREMRAGFPGDALTMGEPRRGIEKEISIDGGDGFKAVQLPVASSDMKLAFRALPHNSDMYYGVLLKQGGKKGFRVLFDAAKRKVGVHRMEESFLREDEGRSLYAVSGVELEVSVELVVRGDILDLCINGERTMVLRIPELMEEPVVPGFFAMCGKACFEDITVV